VRNLKAIHGAAPAVFAGLPAPDAIFIGGLGHEIDRLLEAAWKVLRPGGWMSVNVSSLESFSATNAVLQRLTQPVHVLMVNLARGAEQLEKLRFEAVNPTFLLTVGKPEKR
jgi:precorrin-6B C5,15-methyltransferase / cobalt-precorrin-6B C5,C15-methyltransferase